MKLDARSVMDELPPDVRVQVECDLVVYGNAYVVKNEDGTYKNVTGYRRTCDGDYEKTDGPDTTWPDDPFKDLAFVDGDGEKF